MLVILNALTDKKWSINLLQKFEDVINWQYLKLVATQNDLKVNKIHQSTNNSITSNVYESTRINSGFYNNSYDLLTCAGAAGKK